MEQMQVNHMQEEAALRHPWIRYFARMLDLGIYGTLWALLEKLVLRWYIGNGLGESLVNIVFTMVLMLVLEPVLLSTWGTTPGKWLFGLRLRTQKGETLAYRDAFSRTVGLLKWGMGFDIPIYSLVCFYRSYKKCRAGETPAWDEELSYTVKTYKPWRAWAYAGVQLALVALGVLIILEGQLPPHRGDLTPAQYAANVNDIKKQFAGMDTWRMTPTGEWEEQQSEGILVSHFPDSEPINHELTVQDGLVVGVRLRTARSGEWIGGVGNDKRIAAIAFIGAQPGMNGVRFFLTDAFLKRLDDALSNDSFTVAGVGVATAVEHTGYQQAGNSFLIADEEGKEHFYQMDFEMRKAG